VRGRKGKGKEKTKDLQVLSDHLSLFGNSEASIDRVRRVTHDGSVDGWISTPRNRTALAMAREKTS
jgi:hypothetical protein